MTMIPPEAVPVPARRRRAGPRRWRLVPVALGLAALWTAASFSQFVDGVSAMRMPADPSADAIVVVTGGTARIEVALELLGEGAADRLLISGVHAATDAATLVARTRSDPQLFDCCVDLDRAALDTAGNAREAAAWAQAHAFGSLLVVTSAYHIPRTVREMQRLLPGVTLVPVPIDPSTGSHRAEGAGVRSWPLPLLAREYVKLQLANLRHLFA